MQSSTSRSRSEMALSFKLKLAGCVAPERGASVFLERKLFSHCYRSPSLNTHLNCGCDIARLVFV